MARRKAEAAQTRGAHDVTAFPDFDHSLPMLLLKAREAVMNRFRPMIRRFDLTEQQWRVIRVLAEIEALEAGELAAASYIRAPSLSRILQNLEARRLTTRRPSKRDGRRVMISLSASGRRLFERVAPHSQTIYAEIAEIIGKENLSELYEMLEEAECRLESK